MNVIVPDSVKSKERSTQELTTAIFEHQYGKMRPPARHNREEHVE